jgi:Domain of unknown function (DUF4145)
MAPKFQQAINKSQNQKLSVVCRDCKHSTNHLVLASTDLTGSDDLGEGHVIDWNSHYQILQCQGCDSISFRKASHTSEDYIQVGPDEYELDVLEEIFPNPKEGRLPLKDVDMLPTDVERIYSETLKAINSNQPVLSGIGIRALIETIAKERKASGKDLMAKIDDLVTQGVLTKDGAEIFHKLRILGNTAAHEVKPHSRDQLNLALDVVEHLLQGVYILPLHAKRQFK